MRYFTLTEDEVATLSRSLRRRPHAVHDDLVGAYLAFDDFCLHFSPAEEHVAGLLDATRPFVTHHTGPVPSDAKRVAEGLSAIESISVVGTVIGCTPAVPAEATTLLRAPIPEGLESTVLFLAPDQVLEPMARFAFVDVGLRFHLASGHSLLIATPGFTWSIEIVYGPWSPTWDWADWSVGFSCRPLGVPAAIGGSSHGT